ncbi:MAG: PaaI family thioesterase [Alphaproteobacteria bacterium]
MENAANPCITVAEFERLTDDHLPMVRQFGIRIETIERGRVVARMACGDGVLRPGGTVSGPAMVALADVAMYALVLGLVGPVALAVTTSLNVNFLRKPPPADLVAEGRILKLGKRLAVGEVTLYSDGETEPVSHVTLTYSIPPRDEGGL